MPGDRAAARALPCGDVTDRDDEAAAGIVEACCNCVKTSSRVIESEELSGEDAGPVVAEQRCLLEMGKKRGSVLGSDERGDRAADTVGGLEPIDSPDPRTHIADVVLRGRPR